MKKFLILCLSFSWFNVALAQIVSLNKQEIASLKARLGADETSRNVYDHFQEEAAIYLNDTSNPIDTIQSEGLLQGNPKKVRTRKALADMYKMFALALQYRLTGDNRFLNKSTEFLLAWARKNRGYGNPINDTNIDKAVEAYDLIKQVISKSDRSTIETWLTETAWAEVNSKRMNSEKGSAINNWNAHRLKVVGEIAYALNNKQLMEWTIEQLKRHININLNPDGTSLDFLERDAMHYHIYDLEPMLNLAIMIDRAKGLNFYTYQSPKGASIRKSVEWLLPYMRGDKQHEEYVNTKVAFDRARAKNNEAGFAPGTMFKPKLALPVFELSVYFDPSQMGILNLVRDQESLQSIVNEVKRKKG